MLSNVKFSNFFNWSIAETRFQTVQNMQRIAVSGANELKIERNHYLWWEPDSACKNEIFSCGNLWFTRHMTSRLVQHFLEVSFFTSWTKNRAQSSNSWTFLVIYSLDSSLCKSNSLLIALSDIGSLPMTKWRK